MTDTARIEEAVTDHFGVRCEAFDPDCMSCQAWAEIQAIKDISHRSAASVGVKGLGAWRRGYCDELVTIEQASTAFGSCYQVRAFEGKVWLDLPDQRKEEFATVDRAKAAAQANYERRIRSSLSIVPETEGVGEPVAWPEPKIANPDIGRSTGVPYLDSMIHQVLNAQQDLNLVANETMDQSIADASALLDDVEVALRIAANNTSPQPAAVSVADGWAKLQVAFDAAQYAPGDHPVVPVKLATFMDSVRSLLAAAPQPPQPVKVNEVEGLADDHQPLIEKVMGRFQIYQEMEPEEDEAWDSWYHAAFDMLRQEVREILAALRQPVKVDEAMVERTAKFIASGLFHTSWEGLGSEGRITDRGFKPIIYCTNGGMQLQGRQDDVRELTRALLTSALSHEGEAK